MFRRRAIEQSDPLLERVGQLCIGEPREVVEGDGHRGRVFDFEFYGDVFAAAGKAIAGRRKRPKLYQAVRSGLELFAARRIPHAQAAHRGDLP